MIFVFCFFPVAIFIAPEGEDIVDSGIGLSVRGLPAYVLSGTMNLATGRQ
jgi:hypothetical protein